MTDLHAAIMNLEPPSGIPLDYQLGFNAARHAAAELVSAALAQPEPAAPTVVEPVIFWRCKGCQHAYESDRPSSCDCMSDAGFERVEYYATPPRAARRMRSVTYVCPVCAASLERQE